MNEPQALPKEIVEHIRLYNEEPEKARLWDSTPLGGPGILTTLLLTTRGRKSGTKRSLPLVYQEDGDGFVIVASKRGAPSHPAWYLNLMAADESDIQVGADHFRVHPRVATGKERVALWKKMILAYPPYEEYQAEAGAREIPIVVLTPVAQTNGTGTKGASANGSNSAKPVGSAPESKGSRSFADWITTAQDLCPLIAGEADEAEKLRHMTDKTVAAFKASELYYLTLPQELGGPDLPLVESLEVLETISTADGASGWCLMVGNIEVGTGAAYLPEAGLKTIFSDPKNLLIAGQGIPNGIVHPTKGGYQIKGDWSYGSGIHHADFIHTGCIVMGEDGKPNLTETGGPEIRICLVPRKDVEIKDNWNVLGLRATGSFDYSIGETFVPEEHSHDFAIKTPLRGSHQFTLGLTGYTAWGHTGFALGVGRHALDDLAELARTKGNAFGLMGDGAHFQQRFAHAEASLRAARAFCYSAWDDICESMAKEQPATLDQIALIRLAMCHVHEVVSDICTFAHKAGGGVSLRESALQRCYRDIHAGTQHILLADKIMQDTGKVILGMAPKNAQWTTLGLQAPAA